MRQKKLPRDFMGLMCFVLGWMVGLLVKAIYYSMRFVGMSIHTALIRDRFNRRLRIAVGKTESAEPLKRALGREELRFLTASLGLTDAQWHQSIKLRRRMFEALQTACENAVKTGEFTELEADRYAEDVTKLLFSNFDRSLLTADETRKNKRRLLRLNKSRSLSPNAGDDSESVNKSAEVAGVSSKSKVMESKTEEKSYVTSRLPDIADFKAVKSFSTASVSDWVKDQER